jgi:UDP-N-acetylmuramyl pentapeptide phosphotransferase/UDP-N-acetylglucosamine-1-phosphate transferase
MLEPALIFGLALILSLAIMPLVIRFLQASRIIDVPNRRSSHAVPVPRGGGLGIVISLILVCGGLGLLGRLESTPFFVAILVGTVGMTAVGFLDDLVSLSAPLRLLLEGGLMAACLTIAPLRIEVVALPVLASLELPPAAGWVLAWCFLVGFPNLFNFMDGINGLAAFQALIASLSFAVLAMISHQGPLVLIMAVTAGGSLGFLRYNFPNARVFMGDSGSLSVGFVLAATALALSSGPTGVPLPASVLMLWVFLFDTGLTLVIRVLRGRRVGQAHRQHLYQRLIASGWSHTRVTLLYALAMTAVSLGALLYLPASDPAKLLILIAVLALSGMLAVAVLWYYRLRVMRLGPESRRDD